jgi:hypothetical protein
LLLSSKAKVKRQKAKRKVNEIASFTRLIYLTSFSQVLISSESLSANSDMTFWTCQIAALAVQATAILNVHSADGASVMRFDTALVPLAMSR